MKKFKNLMLMLALALFFVGAMGITKASAAEAVSGGATEVAIKEVKKYDTEIIEVTSDKQVYYQIVKSTEPGKLKPANWIKAAFDNTNKVYSIDFSSVANGKNAYFALTTDATAEDATKVAVVDSVIKSVKVTLNYKAEKLTSAGLPDVIATLNVKGVDSKDDNAEGEAKDYSLKWKRGANGTWAEEDQFNQLQWDMLKASNGTLYVAIDGTLKNGKLDTAFRLSKEAKVKIPKSAKAPTVKVDYVKGTVALKNGMQVRVNDGTAWMDVVAYDKDSTEKELVFAKATEEKTTGKKVSTVSIADFVAAINDEKLLNAGAKNGAEITVTVRTAATNKKFPSMEGSFKVVLPKAAPSVATATSGSGIVVTYTKADKTNKIDAAYKIDFTKLFTKGEKETYDQYEYMFVADKADGTNLAKQKWTKLPENGIVDLSKNIGKDYKYYKASDESKSSGTVKYEAIKAVYIRLAAVKPTNETAGAFASAYGVVEVAVGENVAYTLTSNNSNPAAATFKVGDATVTKALAGAKVVIVYTATEGKEIEKVTYTVEGGEAVTVNVTEGTYSFDMPAKNVTVTVTEKAKAEAGTR